MLKELVERWNSMNDYSCRDCPSRGLARYSLDKKMETLQQAQVKEFDLDLILIY